MKPRDTDTDKTGLWGEKVAARALKAEGYKLLGTRVQVDARSELDIVARDGDVVVFVEVKTRKSARFGRPADFVRKDKRHSLSRAAVRYLKRKSFPDVKIRFDIVEVVGEVGDKHPEVRHIERAFDLDSRYIIP